MFTVRRVRGQSMQPWARENDLLIALLVPHFCLKIGQVVIVSHQKYGCIVKRLQAKHRGRWQLASDNFVAGITSAQIGAFKPPFWVLLVVLKISAT